MVMEKRWQEDVKGTWKTQQREISLKIIKMKIKDQINYLKK